MVQRLIPRSVVAAFVASACFASDKDTIPDGITRFALMEAAIATAEAANRMSEVWPDYWAADRPFLYFVRDSAAILISSDATSPAGFAKVSDDLLPPPLRGRAHWRRGKLPNLETSYDTDYPIGQGTVVAVEVNPSDYVASIDLLFHEAFHKYQAESFSTPANDAGQFVDPSAVSDPAFEAMIQIECALLRNALQVQNPDLLRELLREYLAVRWTRLHSVNDDVRNAEESLERSEGSASLVGVHSVSLAPGVRDDYVAIKLEGILSAWSTFGDDLPSKLIRWRVYGTGGTMGYLMDRLKIDWRSSLKGGRTFADILSEGVQFDSIVAPGVSKRILQRLGFADSVARIASDSTRTQLTLELFDALAPAQLVFYLRAPMVEGQMKATNRMSTESGWSMLAPNVIAVKRATAFEWRTTVTSLLVKESPVLQDMRGTLPEDTASWRGLKDVAVRFVVPVASLPETINGIRPSSSIQRVARLKLDHLGVSLVVDGAVTVERSGSQLVIRQLGK